MKRNSLILITILFISSCLVACNTKGNIYSFNLESGESCLLGYKYEDIPFDSSTATFTDKENGNLCLLKGADLNIVSRYNMDGLEVSSIRLVDTMSGYRYDIVDKDYAVTIFALDGLDMGIMLQGVNKETVQTIADNMVIRPKDNNGQKQECLVHEGNSES